MVPETFLLPNGGMSRLGSEIRFLRSGANGGIKTRVGQGLIEPNER